MKNQRNKKGQRHGYWKLNFNNKINWYGYFINGNEIGLWKCYNENGNINEIRFYSQ